MGSPEHITLAYPKEGSNRASQPVPQPEPGQGEGWHKCQYAQLLTQLLCGKYNYEVYCLELYQTIRIHKRHL